MKEASGISADQMIINDCIALWSLGGGPLKISTAPMAGNPRNPAMSPHTLNKSVEE